MKTSISTTNPLKEIVEKLLIVLSEKEKNIIKRRFALNRSEHETLAKIGNRYHVTRERVRQIQNSAIRKLQRHVIHTPLTEINAVGKKIIMEHSGLIEEKTLYELMGKELPVTLDTEYLALSLELDHTLVKIGNTSRFFPHWKTTDIPAVNLTKISEIARKELAKRKKVRQETELLNTLAIKAQKECGVNETFIASILKIDKAMLFTKQGVGLKSWREINPRAIRDKIFFLLRELKQPMHFRDITENIRSRHFDEKPIHVQAVHNELIRNSDFVLIGRGIYALSEWGYIPGTVAETIENILRKASEPMKREEIVKAVQEQRKVKKITILLNLKGKPQFKRVGRERYGLVK